MKHSHAYLVAAVATIALTACAQSSTQQTTQSSVEQSPAAAPATSHIRGVIANVGAKAMTVATKTGPVAIALTAKTGVAAVVPASRSDIKTGTFIGTANVPNGTTDRALEVVVFPNSMRGTGEGNYSWDLAPASGGSSMMTNGTVASQGAHGGSMMTNGTVTGKQHAGSMMLDVTYKGGAQHIAVPANAPIVRVEAGSPALLVRGAHVFVVAARADGKFSALRVLVGKDGAVPPM